MTPITYRNEGILANNMLKRIEAYIVIIRLLFIAFILVMILLNIVDSYIINDANVFLKTFIIIVFYIAGILPYHLAMGYTEKLYNDVELPIEKRMRDEQTSIGESE